MKTPDCGKICGCSAKAIPTKEETSSTETDKLFLRITSPNVACLLLRVSYLGRGKHAVTGCDGKCLVGCTTNPPLGPISMQWEGVMGNGHALYFNINSLPSSPQCWERVENPSVLVPFCHGSPSNATHLPTGRNIDGDQGFHMTCT